MGWAESNHLPFGYVLRDFDGKTAEDSRHVFTQELEQCQWAGPSTRLPPISLGSEMGSCSFPLLSQAKPALVRAENTARAAMLKGIGLDFALGVQEGSRQWAQEGVTLPLGGLPSFYVA